MKNAHHIPAFVLTAALMVGPVIAETDTVEPQILILSQDADTALPGDPSGASHGVKVNRGSGFPERVISLVEPEEEVLEPAPQQRRRVVPRTTPRTSDW